MLVQATLLRDHCGNRVAHLRDGQMSNWACARHAVFALDVQWRSSEYDGLAVPDYEHRTARCHLFLQF